MNCHTFRATGITAYLLNGGSIESAQAIATHESPRTTKLYDRTAGEITLDENRADRHLRGVNSRRRAVKITTIGPKEKKPRFSSQNSRAMQPSSIVISSSKPTLARENPRPSQSRGIDLSAARRYGGQLFPLRLEAHRLA